jgi:anti-anti-sigma factor
MAELLVEEQEGVLIARPVLSKYPTQEEINDIGHALSELPGKSGGRVILDFQDVQYISSIGLGKLISLQNRCTASDVDLRICSVRPFVMDVIKVARLDRLFKIYDSAEEAMTAD